MDIGRFYAMGDGTPSKSVKKTKRMHRGGVARRSSCKEANINNKMHYTQLYCNGEYSRIGGPNFGEMIGRRNYELDVFRQEDSTNVP